MVIMSHQIICLIEVWLEIDARGLYYKIFIISIIKNGLIS
jgi:hypothetical protein